MRGMYFFRGCCCAESFVFFSCSCRDGIVVTLIPRPIYGRMIRVIRLETLRQARRGRGPRGPRAGDRGEGVRARAPGASNLPEQPQRLAAREKVRPSPKSPKMLEASTGGRQGGREGGREGTV